MDILPQKQQQQTEGENNRMTENNAEKKKLHGTIKGTKEEEEEEDDTKKIAVNIEKKTSPLLKHRVLMDYDGTITTTSLAQVLQLPSSSYVDSLLHLPQPQQQQQQPAFCHEQE
jgi:hypothetical protein